MTSEIRKRDGRQVPFDIEKISRAIFKAAQAVGGQNYSTSVALAEELESVVKENNNEQFPRVAEIQDLVEKILI